MAKDAKITTVSIEVGGHTLELTLAQARELRDVLTSTFPVETPVKVIHHEYDWPYRRPYRGPYWSAELKAERGGVLSLSAK